MRRKKLTEAEMKSDEFLLEFKCSVSVVLAHVCSSGSSSFEYSLIVMDAVSGARPARSKPWLTDQACDSSFLSSRKWDK